MRKVLILLFTLLLISTTAVQAEEDTRWAEAPIITQAYEIAEGKLYLEWIGNSPLYQVYMDGVSVADATVENAIIPIEKGTHTIYVYPVSEIKSADTKINLNFNVVGFDFDLAALGLDHKNLAAGTPSSPLNIDYAPSPIFAAVPDKPVASVNREDRVVLTFSDRHNADEYLLTIKTGKDSNYVRLNRTTLKNDNWISKNNSTVTITLDPSFLQSQGCMVPELGQKYTFSVQLRKYASNFLDGESIQTVIHESKTSADCTYTPVAFWRTAPLITYASQTADGQVTLEWTHDDGGRECVYAVMSLDKKLGIQTGEKKLGETTDLSFVVDDLVNGKYSFAVVPLCENEKGDYSAEANIEIQNDWMTAPSLSCEVVEYNQVKLSWATTGGIESYRVVVYAGNNESLLRFVDLDYSKYAEFELSAISEIMEYTFEYPEEINPENGAKLKFEVYGLRHTAAGEEQRSSSTTQTITIGQSVYPGESFE